MGMDNRDWYRDFWRKKTGYTERADFRISAGQHGRNQHRRASAVDSAAAVGGGRRRGRPLFSWLIHLTFPRQTSDRTADGQGSAGTLG